MLAAWLEQRDRTKLTITEVLAAYTNWPVPRYPQGKTVHGLTYAIGHKLAIPAVRSPRQNCDTDEFGSAAAS
jgi:hypothetical protein